MAAFKICARWAPERFRLALFGMSGKPCQSGKDQRGERILMGHKWKPTPEWTHEIGKQCYNCSCLKEARLSTGKSWNAKQRWHWIWKPLHVGNLKWHCIQEKWTRSNIKSLLFQEMQCAPLVKIAPPLPQIPHFFSPCCLCWINFPPLYLLLGSK